MIRHCLGMALALLALAGCKQEDMYTQGRSQTWDRNSFFANGAAMRKPPQGTVPRLPPAGAPQPKVITAALLDRGQQRFGIFCTPCHGRAGNGEGMIVQRGFTHPPSLVQGAVRDFKAAAYYDVITNGYGAMYGYGDRVSPEDRWAIIAYIRALQTSQYETASALPADDLAKVEASR